MIQSTRYWSGHKLTKRCRKKIRVSKTEFEKIISQLEEESLRVLFNNIRSKTNINAIGMLSNKNNTLRK